MDCDQLLGAQSLDCWQGGVVSGATVDSFFALLYGGLAVAVRS